MGALLYRRARYRRRLWALLVEYEKDHQNGNCQGFALVREGMVFALVRAADDANALFPGEWWAADWRED